PTGSGVSLGSRLHLYSDRFCEGIYEALRFEPPLRCFFVRSTDSRSAAIRSTTSASGSSAGSGSGRPFAFALIRSRNSLRYWSSYFSGSNVSLRFSTRDLASSTSVFCNLAVPSSPSRALRLPHLVCVVHGLEQEHALVRP